MALLGYRTTVHDSVRRDVRDFIVLGAGGFCLYRHSYLLGSTHYSAQGYELFRIHAFPKLGTTSRL